MTAINSYDFFVNSVKKKSNQPLRVEIWHDDFGQGTFTLWAKYDEGKTVEIVVPDYEYISIVEFLYVNKVGVSISHF